LSGQIVESLTAGLLVVDCAGRVEILNPAGRRLLGISDRAVGADYRTLLGAAPALVAVLTECLTTNEAIVRRALQVTAAEGTSHFGVTVSPLGSAQQTHGVICLFSDLTNVVELEEQLRLKEALARLGELTAVCVPSVDQEAARGLYDYAPDPATTRFPLALISPATHRTITSTLGQLVRGHVALEMHPADAEPRRIRTNDLVRVWNASGEVMCRVTLSDSIRPGVVCLPKGLWSRHTQNGRTANALSPDTFTDLGDGACFNDARVDVAPAN